MLRRLVHEFEWIHISLGIAGNLAFFVGSVLFLERFHALKPVGVWLFIVGSFLMLIGVVGSGIRRFYRRRERQDEQA